jgi:hypothetical protein
MRRVLPRRAVHEDDLPPLVVEDLDAPPVEERRRPPWVQLAALALATVAVGALVTIAWSEHDQDRLARHQACVNDALTRAQFSGLGPGGLDPSAQAALAKCFPLTTPAQVAVPSVVSMPLGDAMLKLAQAGLTGRVINGPSGNSPPVAGQAPRAGAKVPAGTEVQLATTPP